MKSGLSAYAVLGLAPSASEAEIRAAYRKLSKQYHPDRNAQGAEKFLEIQTAYRILSEPQLRQAHHLDPSGVWEAEMAQQRRAAQLARRKRRLKKLYQ